MKHASIAAAIALAMLASLSVGAWAGEARPIVVELYTSQGCSSCPPADALLAKLTKRKGLIAMSLPITYWDMLGWKDTLASEANTRRQKAYAAAMGHGGVYTPQIVVDGVKDVVGSREEAVDAAIDTAMKVRDEGTAEIEEAAKENPPAQLRAAVAHNKVHGAWSVGVDLTRTPQKLHVAIGPAPRVVKKAKLDATIWLFRVRSSATVRIGAGENNGRTMTYRNVVSDIKDMGRWRGEPISLDLPHAGANTPPHDSVVVVVQQGGYGRVIGAAYLGRADYYAQQ